MQESRSRFLNRDGSFNVERRGLGFVSSLSIYHSLLTMPWWRFLSMVGGAYLLINVIFACGYLLCGSGSIAGPNIMPGDGGLLKAFFFSVQTFATIGYGHISPVGLGPNILVTFESLFGLLGFALATGLVFARFSRPTAKLMFSHHGLIMPYHGITAFAFRIANQRSNQLIEMEAQVIFSRFEMKHGNRVRIFHPLKLERSSVAFFPLAWTIVHPIDEASPLNGITAEDLQDSDAEFLVLLSGFDETFSQIVHSRTSYKWNELRWNAKFVSVFDEPSPDGRITVNVGRLHDFEHIPTPHRRPHQEEEGTGVVKLQEN